MERGARAVVAKVMLERGVLHAVLYTTYGMPWRAAAYMRAADSRLFWLGDLAPDSEARSKVPRKRRGSLLLHQAGWPKTLGGEKQLPLSGSIPWCSAP